MDRRELLLGASALGLVTNLNLNHPLIAQVGNAVMGSRRLSDRERVGLRGPVKTCNDHRGVIESITDYSPDGRLLGYRVPFPVISGGSVSYTDRLLRPDVTYEFYDKQGRKTRLRKVCLRSTQRLDSKMLEVADQIDFHFPNFFGGTVTTRYNENDQPIESLIRNANGELLTKVNHNYKNGRLISERLVIVRLSEPLVKVRRQLQERFPENEQEREKMAKTKAFLDQLQGPGMECSYTYADDRVIRTLMQMDNFKEDESMTYNEQGDVDWTLMSRSGIDDERRSEFRYLYQYDSHGNWTERTTINCSRPDDPNTQRRTLAYY
jgi:hypothetical protein